MLIVPPHRKTAAFALHLDDIPDRVFPLLCPVAETWWLPGWQPACVFSSSGRIEPQCVFITDDGDSRSVWLVSRYEPEDCMLELVKVTPEHSIGRMSIHVGAAGSDCSLADVVCEYTAIGPEGTAFLDEFDEVAYGGVMERWQDALNHYLRHGRMIGA